MKGTTVPPSFVLFFLFSPVLCSPRPGPRHCWEELTLRPARGAQPSALTSAGLAEREAKSSRARNRVGCAGERGRGSSFYFSPVRRVGDFASPRHAVPRAEWLFPLSVFIILDCV